MRFTNLLLLLILLSVYSHGSEKDVLRGSGMQFIQNKGQVIDAGGNSRPDILYTGDGGGMKIYLRKNGVSYVKTRIDGIHESRDEESAAKDAQVTTSMKEKSMIDKWKNATVTTQRIDIDFDGCNDNCNIIEDQKTEGIFNYYFGNPTNGITNVNAFNKIIYENIYPSINIVFYGGKEHGLKYDIVIKPGGDPNNIKFNYSGAENIYIRNEQLTVEGKLESIVEQMPRVYQKADGEIVDVQCRYKLDDKNNVTFQLETVNPKLETVIDPWITYYGGGDYETRGGISVNSGGDVFITGHTASANFPITPGVFQIRFNRGVGNVILGPTYAFVVKFDNKGVRQWATYYGGVFGDEFAKGISANATNVFICGYTSSGDFPVPSNAYQSISTGSSSQVNGFIFSLNNSNGQRAWATYCGGSENDFVRGIATDNTGVYIAGTTFSDDYPVFGTTFQSSIAPNYAPTVSGDAFVSKFSLTGAAQWSTYYGGREGEECETIAALNNKVVIAGATYMGATVGDFPVSSGAFHNYHSGPAFGGSDGFMVMFDASGNRQWATYYGESGNDYVESGTIDNNGDVVIAGVTTSTSGFATTGVAQVIFAGGTFDGYVGKFNSAGSLVWCTYSGQTGDEFIAGCTTDPTNNIYLLGEWEDITENNLPAGVGCAFQNIFGGLEDQFVMRYDPTGNLLCATYLGGTGEDDLDDVPGVSGGIAYHAGSIFTIVNTNGGYPVTATAFQTTYGGAGAVGWMGDVAVAKLCANTCGDENPFPINIVSTQNNHCANVPIDFVAEFEFCNVDEATYEWIFYGGTPSHSTEREPKGIRYPNPGKYNVKVVITSPCKKDSVTKIEFVVIDPYAGIIPDAGNDTTILIGSNAILHGNPHGALFYWTPSAGLSCSACTNPETKPEITTTYYLIASDDNGCTAVDSVTIEVLNEYQFYIPNSFTPNDDGVNDIFIPKGVNIENGKLLIFDRWGNLIYETNDVFKGWNGKLKSGENAMTDVYVWKIVVKDFKSEEHTMLGHISLLR